MTRRSKSFGTILLTLGVVIYLLADAQRSPSGETSPGETSPGETSPGDDETAKRVIVSTVEAAREVRELRFSGTTRAARRARLAFTSSGRMVARLVEIGDRVRSGQLLARLDDLEFENAVATARATLAELSARRAQTQRDRARAERLAAVKAATREEVERTAASVDALLAAEEAAQARLRETERQLLSRTCLLAPFAGTVTEVLLEPGEYARSGSPVVMLSGDGEVELEVEVPESIISRISVGDAVRLLLPVLGDQPLEGRVDSVGRSAIGPGRLFPVVATVASTDRLVVGATAELVLRLENDQALTLPVEAVVNPGGRRPSVFRVAENSSGVTAVEKVQVEVGTLLGDRVIVYGDLAAGDRVVTGGQRGLLDGETVSVAARVGQAAGVER